MTSHTETGRTVQATEAKAHLAQLLDEVERGNPVTITRHGRAIARIVPMQSLEVASRKAAADRFKARRDQWSQSGMTLDEIIGARHEGHSH